MSQIRAIAYGGGVQSTALLVLAKRREINFPLFLMGNVGADSEDPRTVEYVRDVAGPYAEKNGIQLELLDRVRRDGRTETLMTRLMDPVKCRSCYGTGVIPAGGKPDKGWEDVSTHTMTAVLQCPVCDGKGSNESRSLPIPVRMSNGAPGTRACTADFKIKLIARHVKTLGAHAGKRCKTHRAEDHSDGLCLSGHRWPGSGFHTQGKTLRSHDCNRGPRPDCPECVQANQAVIGIGISLDEAHRANSRRVSGHETVVYPLISVGEDTGLHLSRAECMEIIRAEGLPVPPKSSCYFCPFHKPSTWVELRRERPDLFEKSVQLEATLNARRERLGKDPVWLTRYNKPLDEAIAQPEAMLPGFDPLDDDCDSGYCFL